ncbi:MAG TPA: hypothetical protein VNB29_03340 [Chthoniobacterales bacterium]|nr:hypothetical protein [Chthoniobacterales bacterium]
MNTIRNEMPVAWMASGVLFVGAMAWVFLALVEAPQSNTPASLPQASRESKPRSLPAVKIVQDDRASKKAAEVKLRQEEILARLRSNTSRDINTVYFELVPSLVALDPTAAAQWAQEQSNPQWRDDLMMVVAQSWASFDPDAAQNWTAYLTNPPGQPRERDNMVSYVAFEVARTDPARAVQVLRETEINPERREVMVQNLATQWADQSGGLKPLTNWLVSLPAGEERDRLLARVASSQAQSDPAGAAATVSALIAPGATQERAARDVVRLWAFSDAASAAQWVDRFPHDTEVFRLASETLEETMRQRSGTPNPGGIKSAE